MATLIAVPVLWDGNDQFLNGQLASVSSDSLIIGTVPKPATFTQFPNANTEYINTLFIKDVTFGPLYLNMTLAEWQSAISSGSQSPAPLIGPLEFTIASPLFTITDARLSNSTITQVVKGGIVLSNTAYSYAGDTVTFVDELSTDDVVIVTYYTN